MDQHSIDHALAEVHLPAIRYMHTIDSTNDEALRWIDEAAPHLALVIADEQTAGRGRIQRRWITVPGAALAFSLIFRFPPLPGTLLPRLNALGAVALQSILQKKYHLPAQIKWPNDVLVAGKKASGILVEARWSGQTLIAAVLGIGINISPGSINTVSLSVDGLNFPATCLEDELGYTLDRVEFLHDLLIELVGTWIPRLSFPEFIQNWEEALAFRGEWVELKAGSGTAPHALASAKADSGAIVQGKLVGLTQEGELKLISHDGNPFTVAVGELHLRPHI